MSKTTLETQNGQTLTIVNDGTTITIRIAKDGHNRGIAKLPADTAQAIIDAIAGTNLG